MTSKLKCPFCGEELDWCLSCPLPTMSCPNHNCKAYDFLMTQNCWRELIRTRKALDVAVDALKDTNNYLYGDYGKTKWDLHKTIKQALALTEITALTKGGDNE